jgi:hypothetical protein
MMRMIDLSRERGFTDGQMFPVASFSGVVEIKPSFSPHPQISHVVFDFDGTLSWLRHSWPEIMYELFPTTD